MKTMKVVINNECSDAMKLTLYGSPEDAMDPSPYYCFLDEKWLNVDSKHFYTARDAKKIINDYAVTKLPFVLLVDNTLPEDKQAYAALYSEEGPITIDRINAKL